MTIKLIMSQVVLVRSFHMGVCGVVEVLMYLKNRSFIDGTCMPSKTKASNQEL